MFISSASIDDNSTFVEDEYSADVLSSDLVADLVRSLDGFRHTLVILSAAGEAHMAIGGDVAQGMIVYMTADNLVFYNLLTNMQRIHATVLLVAGGQPAEYDSSTVVTLDEALSAAVFYAETGNRVGELQWSIQE